MSKAKSTDMLLMELMAQALRSEQSQEQRDLIYQLYRTAQGERAAAETEIKMLRLELVAAEEKMASSFEAPQNTPSVKEERSA